MRCPTLSELPSPPPGKTGWPWTEESPQLPDTMPDGRPWPRVRIVTPSYNQAQFIEETIRSVLLQGYPNLEYIIIDGGSTDGSVDIIRKYEKWLAYWVSEPDRGQADAINKGWRVAQGEIVGWLNSDDMYAPGAILTAVAFFQNNPDVDMVFSDCYIMDSRSQIIDVMRAREFDLAKQLQTNLIPQPTVFFRRQILQTTGLLDATLHYIMDYEFWIRVGRRHKIQRIPSVLARFRVHQGTKSSSQMDGFYAERVSTLDRAARDEELRKYLPNEATKRRGLAHFNVGIVCYGYGEMAQARDHFLQAVKLYPELMVRPALLLFMVKSLLGARLMRLLRHWSYRIANRIPKSS